MLSNFYLIVSFIDFDFGLLLILYNVKSLTFAVADIGDQTSRNNHGKSGENLVDYLKNIIED